MAPALSARPGPPAGRTAPVVVARGHQVTVYGQDYFLACQDTVAPGGKLALPSAMPAVPLTLVEPDGRTRPLATARPDRRGSFTLVLTVPRDAPLGRAAVRDSDGQRLELDIR